MDAELATRIAECVREYIAAIGETYDPTGLDADAPDLVGYYSREGHAFWALVTPSGEVLAAVGMRALDREWAELKRMYVRPEARGHGYARYLCEVVVDAARASGYVGIRLDTRRDMTPAITLYTAMGFVETSDYNANPRASVFMERRV